MPSSFSNDDSFRPLIPPTPESDITNSPQSSHHLNCDPSNKSSAEPHQFSSSATLQKRKAGRKPLYKTAQERRDRNRRAQLAFRARRSDYLARLEETCRSLENVVVELQESNRAANDALSRERTKVKYLERMLQTATTFPSTQIPLDFPTSIPPTMNNNAIMSTTGQQGISPTTPTSQTDINSLLFPENYLDQSEGYHSLNTCTRTNQTMSDQFSPNSSLHTPHSIENLEYPSLSASPPSPILKSGFLGFLGLPSLARGCTKRLIGERQDVT